MSYLNGWTYYLCFLPNNNDVLNKMEEQTNNRNDASIQISKRK